MPDINPNFSIGRVDVAGKPALPPTFTIPITAPIACSKIVISNTDTTNAAALRSDPASVATEKRIAASADFTIDCKPGTGTSPAFKPGDVVAFVAPVAAGQSAPLVVSFFR